MAFIQHFPEIDVDVSASILLYVSFTRDSGQTNKCKSYTYIAHKIVSLAWGESIP